jgi:hypothetical protein
MTTVFEAFADYEAPPGHVTFSVLDLQSSGHSVSIASNDYPRIVRATKTGLSGISAAIVFKGAVEIIRRGVVCNGGGASMMMTTKCCLVPLSAHCSNTPTSRRARC